jgi:predicted LPLAT superfamily acyltransferase
MVVFWFMHYNVQRVAVIGAMRRFGRAWPRLSAMGVYLNYAFTLVDRHYWRAGRLHPVMEPTDRSFLERTFDDPSPLVLLGSHCGALELAVPVLELRGRTIRAVARHDPGTSVLLEGVGDSSENVGTGASPIIADGSLETGLEVLRSLRAGEVLTFKSDRALPGSAEDSVLRVEICGAGVLLPKGPAEVVLLAKARALTMFVFRVGPGRFHVEARLLPTEDVTTEELLRSYADDLGSAVSRFPLQWFNFYPYWEGEAEALAELPATVPPVMRAVRYSLRAALLAALGSSGLAAVLAESALWAFPVAGRAIILSFVATAFTLGVGLLLGAAVRGDGSRNGAAWLVSLLGPVLVIAALGQGLAGVPLCFAAAPLPLIFGAVLGGLGALRWSRD